MKHLFLFCNLFTFYLSAQQWQSVPDFPGTARDDGATFSVGQRVYCGTGLQVGWTPTRDFYAYDFGYEGWVQVAPLPQGQARQYAYGISGDTAGYLFGGVQGTQYLNDLWKYSPTHNRWTMVSTLPAAGRSGGTGVLQGDTLYLFGGRTSSAAAISEVWAYCISTDTWLQKPELPTAQWRGAGTLLGDGFYLLGGKNEQDVIQTDLYYYQIHNGNTDVFAGLPTGGRTYNALMAIDDKLITVGGIDSSGHYQSDLWSMDLNVSWPQWKLGAAKMNKGRKGGMCFSSGYTIYYTTGIDSTDTRLTESWKLVNPIGLDEQEMEEIQIRPNPCKDGFYLINTGVNDHPFVEIYSMSGAVLYAETVENDYVGLSSLPSGLYLVKITISTQVSYKRIVKKE